MTDTIKFLTKVNRWVAMITRDLDNQYSIGNFQVHPETFQNELCFLNIIVA